jgi:hypothetical protein
MEDGEIFRSSARVYDEWLLLSAREIVRENRQLRLPGDIAGWVNRAYTPPPRGQEERFTEAYAKHTERVKDQQGKAKDFQLPDPPRADSRYFNDLTGWLAAKVPDDASGKRGEATVRDTEPSVEVIVITRGKGGEFYLLPHIGGGGIIPQGVLDEPLASTVAGCFLALPRGLTRPWNVAKTIKELEKANNGKIIPMAWRKSPWLRDELFLVLEQGDGTEPLSALIGGSLLCYDPDLGLSERRTEA